MSPARLQLQVQFPNSYSISNYGTDELEVEIINNLDFVEASSNLPIAPETKMIGSIPP